MEELGLAKWVHSIETVEASALLEQIDETMVRRDELSATVRAKVAAYKTKFPSYADMICETSWCPARPPRSVARQRVRRTHNGATRVPAG